uniref:PE-PPE domain-containing protein n=1 Tax=Gongylonema pulchrum TaxID=637853 RepID=A0A183DHW3_9BILA
LDVMAAMPSSKLAANGHGGLSQVAAPYDVPGTDIVDQNFTRLFHIPPDFIHQLAAQTGYVNYEPTTSTLSPYYL